MRRPNATGQSSLIPKSTASLIQTGTSASQSLRVAARFLGLLGMAKVSRSLAALSVLDQATASSAMRLSTASGVPAGAT